MSPFGTEFDVSEGYGKFTSAIERPPVGVGGKSTSSVICFANATFPSKGKALFMLQLGAVWRRLYFVYAGRRATPLRTISALNGLPFVAHTPHCNQMLRTAWLLFNLHTQTAYINVDNLFFTHVGVTPYTL